MVRWVVVGLALLFSFAAKAEPEEEFHTGDVTWNLLRSEMMTVPFGTTLSPIYRYNPSLVSTWVRVEFTGLNCGATATRLDVRTAPNENVVGVTPVDGIFKTPGPNIYEFSIYAQQNKFSSGLCTVAVWVAKPPLVGTPPTFTFLDTLQYSGGSTAVTLPVGTQDRVTHVWVEKPGFCQGVEVTGVDFVTNGIPYAAKVSDKVQNIYEIDGGVGSRISHVQVTLAGPDTTRCQLGVYVKTQK